MAKQWEITRSELRAEPLLGGKLYNEAKYQELNQILDYVTQKLPSEDLKTALRSIVEEVTNIIQSNKRWVTAPLKVRSEFNPNTQLVKIHIIYYGDEYYDPQLNQTTTVIGSIFRFAKYERTHTFENDYTNIRITIQLRNE